SGMHGRLGALDTLGMVMRDSRNPLSMAERLFQPFTQQESRSDTHCSPVSEAVVGFPRPGSQPPGKPAAVSPVRIPGAPRMQRLCRMDVMQQGIRHGNGTCGVIRKVHPRPEELKSLGAMVVEFVDRADDIPDDRAQHVVPC